MLTYYATGVNSANNSGTIIPDLANNDDNDNGTVQIPTDPTNSQAGYDSFISALGGADFGIEDFEFRDRSDFTGVGPQNTPTSISLDLDFQRLFPGTGSLPIAATLSTLSPNKALLVDITKANPGPVDNAAGRFPVTIPLDGTQYLDTNTVDLDFLIDFHNTPVSALGFFGTDFGDFNGQVQIEVTDSNGDVTNFGMPHPYEPITSTTGTLNASLLFFGLTSDVPISQIHFSAVDKSGNISLIDRFGFDNLVVATEAPSSVPEPSSLALLLASLVSLGMFYRCKSWRKGLTGLTIGNS